MSVGAARPAPAGAAAAPAWPPAAGLRWRVGAACAVLLFLLLPVLVAGLRLTAPAAPGEVARLERAAAGRPAPGRDQDGEVARKFFRAAAGLAPTVPSEPAAQQAFVVRARIGQLAVLLAASLALYLVVLLAFGRLQAVLACAALAVVPAVAVEGHVLRPETPGLLFTTVGVLLLQCLAQEPRRASARARRSHGWSRAGLAVCAMLATSLGVAAVPTTGAPLLVPGFVLTIAAATAVLRLGPIARRSGIARLPLRAVNRRLLPWTALALATPAVALGVLNANVKGSPDALAATGGAVGWLPCAPALAIVFVVVFALGALAALLQVGGPLRRHGRVTPGLVLLVACAVPLAAGLGAPPGTDRLPLAAATAVLLAQGVFAIALAAGRVVRATPR